jgi:hypothetical protein
MDDFERGLDTASEYQKVEGKVNVRRTVNVAFPVSWQTVRSDCKANAVSSLFWSTPA